MPDFRANACLLGRRTLPQGLAYGARGGKGRIPRLPRQPITRPDKTVTTELFPHQFVQPMPRLRQAGPRTFTGPVEPVAVAVDFNDQRIDTFRPRGR